MNKKGTYHYNTEELYDATVEALKRRGVELKDIAEIVYTLQKSYRDDLTMEMCMENVDMISPTFSPSTTTRAT